MRKLILMTGLLLLVASPALSQYDRSAINAFNDSARAQERQADSLRRMESFQRDQARQADRQYRNAERDSRSMRRFDR
jgi:hypothetical protein